MRGNTARKEDYNTINVMTYADWCDLNDEIQKRGEKKRIIERKKRARYFEKQRRFGFMIIGFSSLMALGGRTFGIDGLCLMSVFVALAGLFTIFTKQMILVDEYYLDYQDRI